MLESYRNTRTFITGHTGFKGSWLVASLNKLGATCSGYALTPNTSPAHYDLMNLDEKGIIGDILELEKLQKSINDFNPEIVFHLAAQPLVKESYHDPLNTYRSNVIGTLNLLEAVKNCPSVKALVVITTDKVYENKEWVFPYREEDRLGGHDMYSSSKACTEILVNSFRLSFLHPDNYKKNHDKLIATARAGNVIGGGDWSNDRLIPDLVRAASNFETTRIRNPYAVRPWQHVLDCLYGYLLLGERLLSEEKAFAEAWNFAPSASESMTVKEVAALSTELWGDMSIVFDAQGDHPHEANLLKLDNTKSCSLLKWKPKWDTKKAIEKTIEWYKIYYEEGEISTDQQIEEYFS